MDIVVLLVTYFFSSKLGPYIARKRTAEVQKKYGEIGGGSPILKWTQLQVCFHDVFVIEIIILVPTVPFYLLFNQP